MDWIFAIVYSVFAIAFAVTEVIFLVKRKEKHKKQQNKAIDHEAKIVNYYPRIEQVKETYYKMGVAKPRVHEDRD